VAPATPSMSTVRRSRPVLSHFSFGPFIVGGPLLSVRRTRLLRARNGRPGVGR
jgi:hypothetical protein